MARADEGPVFAALPRVLLAERGEDVTRRLAELMLEVEREAPRAALDGIANALADVLIRRQEVAERPLPITTMEALMQNSSEWLYTPGVPELRKRIADVEGELVRERQARREQELALQQAREVLVRLAVAVVPDLDEEQARSLSLDELQALVDARG